MQISCILCVLSIHFISMQCINRVAEKLEQTVGAVPADVSKSIKSKFVSMVERHYLQRVRPPGTEVTLASHGAQEMGGVVQMPVFGKFELPSTVNGNIHVWSIYYSHLS